jgi:hypothetical protein
MISDVQQKLPYTRAYVTIDSVDPGIIEKLVEYIYTGKIKANLQEIEGLKTICELLQLDLPLLDAGNEINDSNIGNRNETSENTRAASNIGESVSNFNSPCNGDLLDQWKTANEILSEMKMENTDSVDNFDCNMITAEGIRVPNNSENGQIGKQNSVSPDSSESGKNLMDQRNTRSSSTSTSKKSIASKIVITGTETLFSKEQKSEHSNTNSSKKVRTNKRKEPYNGESLVKKCNRCKYSALTISMLNTHIKHVHRKTYSKQYHKRNEATHIETFRKPSKSFKIKDYICELCAKAFGTKPHLDIHKNLVHLKIKPYSCIYCQKRFGTTSMLKAHQQYVHEKVKNHSCDLCSYMGTRKGDVKRHKEYVHYKTSRFKCNSCNYQCFTLAHFKRHQNTKKHIKNGNVPNLVPDRETSSTENVSNIKRP